MFLLDNFVHKFERPIVLYFYYYFLVVVACFGARNVGYLNKRLYALRIAFFLFVEPRLVIELAHCIVYVVAQYKNGFCPFERYVVELFVRKRVALAHNYHKIVFEFVLTAVNEPR